METYKEGDILKIENQSAKVCRTCMHKIKPDEQYVPIACSCCDTQAFHHASCLKDRTIVDKEESIGIKVTKVDQ